MNFATEWIVGVTTSGGLWIEARDMSGGHVYQLTLPEADALARQLRNAAARAIVIPAVKTKPGEAR